MKTISACCLGILFLFILAPFIQGGVLVGKTQTLSEQYQTDQMIKYIFPAFDNKTGVVLQYKKGTDAVTIETRICLTKYYREQGINKFFLVFETIKKDSSCHVCAPQIGSAIFMHDGIDWRLRKINHGIITSGAHGRAPECKFINIGPDSYAILFEPVYTMNGEYSASIFIIGERANTIDLLLDLDYRTDFNNSGQCRMAQEKAMPVDYPLCFGFNSKIKFLPGATPGYFDLKIITRGTRCNDNGEIISANIVRHYKFDNSYFKWIY
jgi:hypothetical protein